MSLKILPNQARAFDTAAEAWAWAKGIISAYGSDVIDEDGKNTREVQNLQVTVLHPSEGWPVDGSDWSSEGLEQYARQLMSPNNDYGFAYTYGMRLFAYCMSPGAVFNQIDQIIRRLKTNPTSRRGIAITWIPEWDSTHEEVPCLQLIDFLFRCGKLHLTAFFRSHDIERAYPPNLYGLNKLLEYVAREAGMEPGSITTISASAHIYVE